MTHDTFISTERPLTDAMQILSSAVENEQNRRCEDSYENSILNQLLRK